jgi:transcriptional regulator with XRE-family HTH domain
MSDEQFSRLREIIACAVLPQPDGTRRSYMSISLDAGFGRNYVQTLLKRGTFPKYDSLVRLCRVLGTSPSYILFGASATPDDEELLRRIQALPPEKQHAIRTLLNALDPDT